MSIDKLYPVTIIMDRHFGSYSGGKWVALNLDAEDSYRLLPGDDVDCMNFWENEINSDSIGVGETPQLAYENLQKKYEELMK